jgi:hypothetical protein
MPDDVKNLYSKLIKEFNCNDYNKIILSCERFAFCRDLYIKSISEFFEEFDVKIIFYIRKQSSLLLSDFLQKIKAGVLIDPSFDNYFENSKDAFKYTLRIKFWEKYFGIENLIVRVYDDPQIKSDVCKDFNNVTGISSFMKTNKIVQENQSIISEFVNISTHIHKNIQDKELKQIMMKEIVSLSNYFKKSTTKLSLTSIDGYRTIDEFYNKDNIEFVNKYLTEDQKRKFLN